MRGASDPAEQARLFELLAQVLEQLGPDRNDLAGLFVWDWSTDPEAGLDPSAPPSFSPQNRPAEHGLARLFALR